jgi:hypothetical protein
VIFNGQTWIIDFASWWKEAVSSPEPEGLLRTFPRKVPLGRQKQKLGSAVTEYETHALECRLCLVLRKIRQTEVEASL